MYHCDAIIENGNIRMCSVSKYLNSTLNFHTDGYLGSVMIDQGELQERLQQFNKEVIHALAYENGVTHLEAFVQPDGQIVFCEIAKTSRRRWNYSLHRQCIWSRYSGMLYSITVR